MSKQKLKLLPIGIPDWDIIHNEDFLFVDKTAFLPSILSKHKVFIARPRRMGKTVLCSMLKALFTHGIRDFAGTKLEAIMPPTIALGPYPVISLSFVNISDERYSSFAQALIDKLSSAYTTAGFAAEVDEFKRSAEGNLGSFLEDLSMLSERHQLVFLIDAWDHPLTSNLDDKDKYQAIQQVLKQFYAWLCHLPNIRFLLVTGIMGYRHLASFIRNDLYDLSWDPHYASLLGYTHQELETYFAPYITDAAQRRGESPEELLADLKAHYECFCFDPEAKVKVYSPWDINQFFEPLWYDFLAKHADDSVPQFKPYWVKKMAASLIYVARRCHITLPRLYNLKRRDIVLTIDDLIEDDTYFSLEPLLVDTGTLTIKESIAQGVYRCSLTNLDAEQDLARELSYYIRKQMSLYNSQIDELKEALRAALVQGDIAAACTAYNELLGSLREGTCPPDDAVMYQTLLAIWLEELASDVRTTKSIGRYTIKLTIAERAYVFELRLSHNLDEHAERRWLRYKYRLLQAATEPIRAEVSTPQASGRPVTGVILAISCKRQGIVAWRKLEASSDSCGRVSNVKHFAKGEVSSTTA